MQCHEVCFETRRRIEMHLQAKFRSRPHWGAVNSYSAPSDPIAGFVGREEWQRGMETARKGKGKKGEEKGKGRGDGI